VTFNMIKMTFFVRKKPKKIHFLSKTFKITDRSIHKLKYRKKEV